MPSEADIAALLDEPEIVPWDRRPLLIVIAAAAVLVLIGLLSGFVATKFADPPTASWRDAPPSTAPTGEG